MKDYIIKLSDKYDVPHNISRVSTEEWEIIISYISDLLLKHDSISSKIASTEIEQMLETKYRHQINTKEEQINLQLQEITNLKDNYEKQLKKQRKAIESDFKVSAADSLQSKEVIIQALKEQVSELQQALTNNMQQTNINQIIPLQEQIATYVNEINNLKDSHNKQLKEQHLSVEHLQSQINKYQQQLNTLQIQAANNIIEEKAKAVASVEAKYEDKLNNARQQSITEMRDLISKYNSEIKLMHAEHNKQINELRNQADQRTAEQLSSLTAQHNIQFDLQDTILKTLDPVLKFYGGSNNEKGVGGEIAIRDILMSSNTYDEAIVEDVSGLAASGDIIFTWKKMRCLIEVKNKSKLTKDDFDKFKRDVVQSSDKINCAIFISLQTNHFPGRSRELMQLDYVNGIPVIYTYMPPPSKEIHFAIACLERIIQTSDVVNSDQEELQQHFIKYYDNILIYQKFFDQELKKHQREIKAITKHADHFNTLCEQLSPLYVKLSTSADAVEDEVAPNPESNSEHNSETNEETEDPDVQNTEVLSDDPDERLLQLMNEYIKLSLKNKSPSIKLLSQSFNVSETTIEYIGLKNIAANAKQMYMANVISEDKIAKLQAFYVENNRYPNRKELTNTKILPDHILRNISKVTKQKKVVDAITAFLETYTSSEVEPTHQPTTKKTKKKVRPVDSNIKLD